MNDAWSGGRFVEEFSRATVADTLIESTFVTLDGVIESPEKWGGPYWDQEFAAYAQALLDRADAILLGRSTYDGFADSWPQRAGDPYADRINSLPKFVATRSGGTPTWNNTRFLKGDVATAVKTLKDQFDGDILKFGTGDVDRALLEHAKRRRSWPVRR